MSGGYYKQAGGYGTHHHQESNKQPQYLHQNYGYQNAAFSPAYQNHPAGFAAVSEEYLRQPATSPYPTAPIVQMPEPPAPLMRMTEPPAQQEPRVIIVQQSPKRDDECCQFASALCKCIDWLLTQICYVIFTLVLIAVLLGLGVWLYNKYKHH